MNNIIKIWLVTIIVTLTSMYLTSVAFAEEKAPIEDTLEWFKYTDGEEEIYEEHYMFYDGTSEEMKYYTVILHTNDYTGNGKGAYSFCVVYYCEETGEYLLQGNSNGAPQKIKCPYSHIAALKVVYEPNYIVSSSADFYYDFGDENIDYEEFKNSIINNELPDGTITLNPELKYDNVIGEWVDSDIKYDLEIPQDVSVVIPEDYAKGIYKINWNQSENFMKKDFYKEVQTQIYVKYYGDGVAYPDGVTNLEKYKFESNYFYYDSVFCKKGSVNMNFEKNGTNKLWTMRHNYLADYLYDMKLLPKNAYVTGIEDYYFGGQYAYKIDESVNYHSSDFILRNYYIDDDGIQHYSNYVVIRCHNDGTYELGELDGITLDEYVDDDYNIDIKDDTEDKIIVDDSIYDIDDELVTDIPEETVSLWQGAKNLFKSIKQYPMFFTKIFNFLPDYVVDGISFGIVFVITIGLVKFAFK